MKPLTRPGLTDSLGVVPDVGEIVDAIRRSLGLAAPEELSAGACVDVLRRNQLPLLSLVMEPGSELGVTSAVDARDQARAMLGSLAGRVNDPYLLAPLWSDEFAAALSDEIAIYAEAHGEYARLAEAWSHVGIPCICFKSAGIAPSFPYTSGNIDILVLPEHVSQARHILRALGYVELRNIEEPLKWLFRRFVAGRSVSAIHLHAQVGWGQGYMLEEALWARAVRSPDDPWTWVPGREDAALINLAHAWVENKEIGLHDLVKIRHALSSGAVDWVYIDHVAQERGWQDGLHFAMLLVAHLEDQLYGHSSVPADVRVRYERALRANRWLNRYWDRVRQERPILPFHISFVVSKVLHFYKLWEDQRLAAGEKPAQTVLELARGVQTKTGIRPQQSMLIALSGVDGSGKSVQARMLAQAFDTSDIRQRMVWARVGATPLLHTLYPLWGRIARGKTSFQYDAGSSEGDWAATHPGFSRRGWRLSLWAAVAGTDYAAWLLYVRWRLLRGDVVIADRFLCDFEVEFGIRLREHPHVAAALLGALRRLAPEPRRAYLLRIDPDQASRRARPDSRDDIDPADACYRYDVLSERYGLRVLDAALPVDDLSGTIAHDALSAYMERFNPFGNVVFFSNRWQLNPGPQWNE